MRVNSLRLENYTLHQHLDIEFSDGLIGIIGDNGSGKTNLVSSIFEVITGDFRKKKDRMITYGEKKGKGTVDLGTNDGGRLVISRNLHNSDCRLEIFDPSGAQADQSPIVSADAVSAAMSSLFPYPSTVLKGVIFTPQESITSLLFDPKSSVRERMAMSFFGVEKAEEVEAEVASVLSGIQIPSQPHGYIPSRKISEELIPEAESAVSEADDDLRVAVERRDSAKAKVESMEGEAVQAKAWIKKNEATQWESATLAKISTLRDQISEIEEERAQKVEILSGVDVDDLRKRVSATRELERLESLEAEAVRVWDGFLKSDDSNLQEEVEAARKDHTDSVEERQRAAVHLSSIKDQVRSWKVLLEGDDKSECTTCLRAGLTKVDLKKIREKYESSDEAVAEAEERFGRAGDLVDESLAALKRLESRKYRRDQERETAFENLGSTGAKSVSAREAIVKKWSTVKSSKKLAEVLEIAVTTQSDISSIDSTLSQKRRHIEDLEEELAESRNKQDDSESKAFASPKDAMDVIDKLDKVKNRFYEAREEASEARVNLKSAHENLAHLQDLLQTSVSFESKLSEAEEKRRLVSAVRSVFHYSAAPKKVVSARLRAVSKRINSYLEAFESRFTVDAREGFDFDCVFGGRVLGKVMSPQDLSGGEKVTLSVAFRLAAAETFCSDAGFLVLDEPTVWMDKKRIENIPRVMEKLSRIAKERGLQYFVVTHDTRLMGCFDQLIELSQDE